MILVGKQETPSPFCPPLIAKITKNFKPGKCHGHDMISIRMIYFYDGPMVKLFELIVRSCFESGQFPSHWKKLTWFR